MGTYSGGSKAVDAIIRDLRSKFKGSDYHVILKNCNAFSEEFVRQLNGREIPGYVNRLAFIGSIFSCLLPNDMNQAPVQDGSGGGSTSGGVYGSSGQARNRFPAPGPNKFSGKGMKLGGN